MTLGVPPDWRKTKLKQFIGGIFKLAKEYKLVCIGGDMTASKQFFCSVTILGRPVKKSVLRSGAKKDDLILVTGSLGGSIHKKALCFYAARTRGCVAGKKLSTVGHDGYFRWFGSGFEAFTQGFEIFGAA